MVVDDCAQYPVATHRIVRLPSYFALSSALCDDAVGDETHADVDQELVASIHLSAHPPKSTVQPGRDLRRRHRSYSPAPEVSEV